jgi:hypothetical protein
MEKIIIISAILLLVINLVLQILIYTKSPRENYQQHELDDGIPPCPACRRWSSRQAGFKIVKDCTFGSKCKQVQDIPYENIPFDIPKSVLIYRPDILPNPHDANLF